MKILFLDLETSPNLAHVWGLWDQNIAITQIESSTEVICWGARWLGSEKVIFKSVHHHGKEAMLDELHKVMDEADVLIGWNSAAFDSKHIKREFIENGYMPPSPWIELDLMKVVRSQFKFPSNKLDYVAQKLGVGAKVQHSGFQLWLDCMAGIPKAWKMMKEYQIQDVNLLLDLYDILLPWIKNHPHVGVAEGKPEACRNCGHTKLNPNGSQVSGVGKFRKYQCASCGTHHRGEKLAGAVFK
ncbi:MAG: ribonuclease H-like domain-containing protein [Roseovarius sp.]